MPQRLRQILFSVPAIIAVVLLALYLAGGFLALPAIVKWQLEKQVPEQLGQRISVGAVHFNPLALRLDVDDLALSDPDGQPLIAVKRLQADFELRSVLDRAWVFASATLEAPVVHLELTDDGRNNFSPLLERLAGEPAPESGGLPRLVVKRVALTGARVDFSDRRLAPPLVARVEPLQFEIADLSTLPASAARYRLSARTAAGESLTLAGGLGLDPVAVSGELAVKDLAVATVVRGLSRLVALDSPAGTIGLAARFDLGVDAAGTIAGTVQDVDLDVAKLSVAAAGADTPLLAMESLALNGGRVDLDSREVAVAKLVLADGRVAAAANEQSVLDWSQIVRASGAATPQTPPVTAADTPRSGAAAAAPKPWHIAVASTTVSDIAVKFLDAASRRRASVDAVGIDAAATATVGAAGMRIELRRPRLSLAASRLEDGADRLDLPAARIEADGVSIDAGGERFELALDAPRVSAPEGATARQGEASLVLGGLSVGGAGAAVVVEGATTTGTIDDASVGLASAALNASGQSVQLGEVSVAGSRIALRAQAEQVGFDVTAPRGTLADLRMAQAGDGLDVRAATLAGETLSLAQSGAEMRIAAGAPAVSLSGIDAHRGDERAAAGELSLAGKALTLTRADDGPLELALDAIRTTAGTVALNRGTDGIDVRTATLNGDAMTLTHAEGQVRITGGGAGATIAGVAARQGSDRIALEDAAFDAREIAVAAGGGSPDASVVEASLAGVALRLASVGIVAQGATAEVLRFAAADVGAESMALGVSDAPLALTGEGLTAKLVDVAMNSPADATEMARIGSVTLDGGAFNLADRAASAGNVTVAGGNAQTWIDAQGRFNGLVVIRGLASATAGPAPEAAPEAPHAPDAQAADSPWRLALGSVAVDDFAVGFEDRRVPPALAVGFDAIRARIADLDTASATPMQIEFQANVAGGGDIRTSGSVRLDNGAADLQATIAGVALSPAQRYLSEVAALRLGSGTVSAEGRLRFGDEAGAGARFAYAGSVAVDGLQLEEVEPQRPFLAWNSVATGDLVLTLGPDRVDIGELRIEGPSGRLVIAEDRTVNLTDVLKPAEPEAPPAPKGEPADEPFPVSIARVRVTGGELDFADLSLRPQFGARMHDLKGVVTGLATDNDDGAELQLDAQVDEYGSARIRGRISVLDPEALTDVEMAFRNLEMTSLSPYVVKFAGYRIAAGRLALDLEYKVRNGKLAGKNKIVLNQVELGEKVDSPGALDLPLDLAIAILKDADGVIDIGLPVSGDLNDPTFDYGEVIGKAMGNMLGKIVTAPFGALGALFGGGERKLDTIDFEPGRDTIAPPERQKLEAVARALKERPALRLVVPPTYAPAQDTAVLKSLAVRTDIVTRMGGELPPDEDPGPIDTANPRVQRAVEAAFSARNSPAALAALKRRAVEAAAPAGAGAASPAPPAKPSGGSAAAGGAPKSTTPPSGPPPAFYQGLVEQMISTTSVSEPMLGRLAERRGDAIVRELTTVGGVPAERVALGELRKASAAGDDMVALQLELGVAK